MIFLCKFHPSLHRCVRLFYPEPLGSDPRSVVRNGVITTEQTVFWRKYEAADNVTTAWSIPRSQTLPSDEPIARGGLAVVSFRTELTSTLACITSKHPVSGCPCMRVVSPLPRNTSFLPLSACRFTSHREGGKKGGKGTN